MSKDKSAPSEPESSAAELGEEELESVNGGTKIQTDVTVNRVKSSDKAAKAVLDYVKG